MKKIVHIAYEHRAQDVRILQKECMTLAKNSDYKLTYITSSKNSQVGILEYNGVTIVVKQLTGSRGWRMLNYIREIKCDIDKYDADAYHIHESVLLPLVKFLKHRGKVVIYDKHESTVDDIEERFRNKFGVRIGRIAAYFAERYENQMISICDAYISVTPTYTGHDEQINKQAVMIPNFPDKERKLKNREFNEFTKYSGKMCFAGAISYSWSMDKLIDLLGKTEGIYLNLAGHCVDGSLQYMQRQSAWSKVDFHGRISFDEVAKMYEESYIGVALLHFKSENLNKIGTLGNTKLFEFMQAGLPVICSDSRIWKEIISEYKCGICVDPLDEDAVIYALQYLVDNPNEAYKMGENGKKAVNEKYNWQRSGIELCDLYNRVLGE